MIGRCIVWCRVVYSSWLAKGLAEIATGPSHHPHQGTLPGLGTYTVWVSAAGASRSEPWAVGFFFGNTELSPELWPVISGISGFDD